MMEKITCNIEIVTPEIAKRYLAEDINCHNRNISENRVSFYLRELREGRWQFNGDTIRFDINGKLLDGQHRLTACVRANIPIECIVVRGLPSECQKTIDQGKGRTATDNFAIEGIANANVVASTIQKFYKLKATGKAVIACYGGREKFVSMEELLHTYREAPDKYQQIANMASRLVSVKKLFGKSEVGAYIAFLHFAKSHDLDYIFTFFSMLFHYKTDKRTSLCEQFNDKMFNSEKEHQPLSAKYKQQLLIKCWNDYVGGGHGLRLQVKKDEEIEFL